MPAVRPAVVRHGEGGLGNYRNFGFRFAFSGRVGVGVGRRVGGCGAGCPGVGLSRGWNGVLDRWSSGGGGAEGDEFCFDSGELVSEVLV